MCIVLTIDDIATKLSRARAATLGLATIIAMLGAAASAPTAAQSHADTVAAFDDAFADWMRDHRISRGVLAVARQGRVVHAKGFGMPAEAPVPIASLSKSVTAVCVAGLVQRGTLRFDTPLASALAGAFQRLGPPTDPRLSRVTIAQLLTHHAGYQRSNGAQTDPVINGVLIPHLRGQSAAQPAIDAQTRALLHQSLPLPPGERHAYSNAPYLLLGAVIEEATGTTYEAHCRSTTLAPAGAPTAALTPGWRVLSSYGGWQFTATEYLRFHEVFGAQGPVLSAASRQWLLTPDGKAVSRGVHYGLGMLVRPAAAAHNFWHRGSLSLRLERSADGPLSVNFGTYVARLGPAGFSWFAYYEPGPAGQATLELDRRMADAGRAVRRWP
jgi:CubicO group peptidase (beta-lactamase class C family)